MTEEAINAADEAWKFGDADSVMTRECTSGMNLIQENLFRCVPVSYCGGRNSEGG
jgi:hypothetical protein